MTAATMQQTPAIPPRPVRNQDQDDSAASVPKIPPRPASKRLTDRSISPNPDRFAPSPLNDGIPQKSPRSLRFSPNHAIHEHSNEPIARPTSVSMPSVGEEGCEYNAVTEEADTQRMEKQEQQRATSPEQTRTIGDDLKLHAPKPSLPAQSAKQRVQTVTRTDSDKAATFGIGRPASVDGLKKKPSTAFSATDSQPDVDDNEGIPEIGQRVPMNRHLGDVQAPSPAPGSDETKKHHHRKHSSRGGPPGSYGMHGHGVAPQDKLDKAYYEKNPHIFDREHKTPIHDRQNDFAMSSNDLNKLVRDTVSRGAGLATSSEYHSTPTEEVGFQASEEFASRLSSPRPASTLGDKSGATAFKSEITGPDGERTVHVDDPQHPQYRSPGDIEHTVENEEHEYTAPILAPDEVSKDKSPYRQQPAVHPRPERRRSSNDMDDSSRPTSRPTSIYRENSSQDFGSTPLDDVKEYEPLFPEEGKKEERAASEAKARQHFPSKDIWEDAPNSVHYTAEVSTPDLTEKARTLSSGAAGRDRPKTPAHAFAQKQEELAEKEVNGPADIKPHRSQEKPTWNEPKRDPESFLPQKRPTATQRFPSRDIWEDVPESQLYEATVSASSEEETKPEVPSRPVKNTSETSERPAIPERPKPKQTPSDENQKARPPVSDKPKPQIPPRPTKSSSGDSKDGEFSKPKPPVPSRPVGNKPVGSKIAALQAGFMSDLNKRLQLGPQAPKKEEPKPQEDLTEEKEKAPLPDARKSRARGPQRRAPAAASGPTLSFSMPQTFWSVDPDHGSLAVAGDETPIPAVEEEEKQQQTEQVEQVVPQVQEEQGVEKPEEAPVALAVEEPFEEKLAEEKPAEEQSVEKTPVAEKLVEEQPVNDAPAEETAVEEKLTEPAEDVKRETPEDSIPSSEEKTEAPKEEIKTLAANTAGESILETTIEKKDGGNEVEPVEVTDAVKA
ncbi:hypothetical protein AK830_g9086 [Neonectria ditissima]|uniref:Altered inheritance of mitochondria protein 21 n=1 Tax=Neonectria ditissima TaxID=78410 RepID=A0A0P7BA82_9HYPO|nr:hypothetical protein AK830_g9086 [Neonectria ditissima]